MKDHIIRKCIDSLLDKKRKNIAVYPYGELGYKVTNILKQYFDISPVIIFDNTLCHYNKEIKPISYLMDESPIENIDVILICSLTNSFSLMETIPEKYKSKIVLIDDLLQRENISNNPENNCIYFANINSSLEIIKNLLLINIIQPDFFSKLKVENRDCYSFIIDELLKRKNLFSSATLSGIVDCFINFLCQILLSGSNNGNICQYKTRKELFNNLLNISNGISPTVFNYFIPDALRRRDFQQLSDLFDKLNSNNHLDLINSISVESRLLEISYLLLIDNLDEACIKLNNYVKNFGLEGIDKLLPVASFSHKNKITNEKIYKSAKLFYAFKSSEEMDILNKSICNKTIAIVGNGPQEKGKNLGKEIDSHDIVIRFNKYNSEYNKSDYGSKTSILVKWAGVDVDLNLNYDLILCNDDLYTYFWTDHQINNIFSYINKFKNIEGKIFSTISTETIKEIPIEFPSSGFRAVWLIKKLNPSLSISDVYGFSFKDIKIDKYCYQHYFKGYISNAHDLEEEKEYLINLFN